MAWIEFANSHRPCVVTNCGRSSTLKVCADVRGERRDVPGADFCDEHDLEARMFVRAISPRRVVAPLR